MFKTIQNSVNHMFLYHITITRNLLRVYNKPSAVIGWANICLLVMDLWWQNQNKL